LKFFVCRVGHAHAVFSIITSSPSHFNSTSSINTALGGKLRKLSSRSL
jgi:hypothetical protein